VYENRRLRKIFGLKVDEVTRDWRRLHSEELYDLYCSLNTFRGKQNMKNWMRGAWRTYG
jgi:hypothetical protein